jgi:hypothetical protein
VFEVEAQISTYHNIKEAYTVQCVPVDSPLFCSEVRQSHALCHVINTPHSTRYTVFAQVQSAYNGTYTVWGTDCRVQDPLCYSIRMKEIRVGREGRKGEEMMGERRERR